MSSTVREALAINVKGRNYYASHGNTSLTYGFVRLYLAISDENW